MTNKTILEKAISLAIDGGWRGDLLGHLHIYEWEPGKCYEISNDSDETWSMEEIIFNKAFAKALWGEEPEPFTYIYDLEFKYPVPKDSPIWYAENRHSARWKLKLQQMVLADDPIKYLGDNI